MKLSQYLPATPLLEKEQRLNFLTGVLSDMTVLKSGEIGQARSFGVDQVVVNAWLRQQMAYRQQMIVDLLTIALTIEEIRSPINRIIGEVFRKGIQWRAKFAVKCERCKQEYTDLVSECENCQSQEWLRKPDESQKRTLDIFQKDCNLFDQSLLDVLKQVWFDVNAVDDGYIYLAKEYFAEDMSDVVRSRVTEIRRLNPALVELDLDQNGLPKVSHFLCFIHRDSPQTVDGICSECGRDLVPAMYKYWHRGQVIYLLDSEIIHLQKFQPSETYGWSPVLTVFEKALSIRGMDAFLYRYFFERKMPASMIMVFTDDPESLRRERENIAARTRMDPNYVPMVAVSANKQRGRVDMVRLMHTLQEMDYLPVRQEIRERIADLWGVTPVWQGSPEAVAGLATSTPQLVVMSRVVEADQRVFNAKALPLICEAFGVTDWLLELLQPEEKAEATRIAFAQQRVSIAQALFQMGFDVSIKMEKVGIDDIDFLIAGAAKRPEGMFGGFGGMGVPNYSAEGGGQEHALEQPVQYMQKAATWLSQIQKAGYPFPIFKAVSQSGDVVIFESQNVPFVAKFVDGILHSIEAIESPRPFTVPHSERAFGQHNGKNMVDVLEDSDEP